jgi:two-component system, chemotaxis family, protein-glutamate methylesterase/glutaminase
MVDNHHSGSRYGRDIVVIGASAGGLEALIRIVSALPQDLPAALFIVVHTGRQNPSFLPSILSRAGPLQARHPWNGEEIRAGRIFVAPPDHHMLLSEGTVTIARGPEENGFRPAIDPLFRTAARSFGPRVAGVILSGGLDDGVYGLALVKEFGGVAIVQDPNEALVPSMPLNALRTVTIDHVMPADKIASALTRLASEPNGPKDMEKRPQEEASEDVSEEPHSGLHPYGEKAPLSPYTCPTCGGAMWDVTDHGVVRYRCHTGHGFTERTLAECQGNGIESALWTALRTLEQNAALSRTMAQKAENGQLEALARSYRERALESEERAAAIRKLLREDIGPPRAVNAG